MLPNKNTIRCEKAVHFANNKWKPTSNKYKDFISSNEYKQIQNISNDVLIYPNPASQQVSISLPNGFENANVVMTDLSGRIILNSSVIGTNSILDISQISNGLFIITITFGEKISIQKITIIK